MFFVVELLEPKTVGHLLRENVHISMLRRILMAKDCATGMSWLHGGDVQVLHRDLKPDNLLMDKDWNVKVCDFGLSRVKEKNDQRLSIGVGGTPLWIAPEVFRKEKLTPASDVYSFGLVLWEIVTGDVLFPDLEDFDDLKHQVLYKKLRPKIPEKNRQGEEIIPELGQLMRECWEDDPYRRPAFIDIAKRLEVIYVKVGLKDKEARNIWLKIMTKEDITTVELEKLCEELGIESEFTTMECLKRLIAHQDHRPRSLSSSKDDVASQEKKGSFICSIEDFAHAVNWFGPIDPLFSQRINSIVSCPFFVGPMDVKSAEENLEGENVLPGTFLVRASKTRPDAPFSLSVRQKEKISHIRINKKNNKFSVKIHNDQVIESTGTDLPAFINTISTVLALGKPLENANPYQSIFRKTNSEVHKDSKDPYGHYE